MKLKIILILFLLSPLCFSSKQSDKIKEVFPNYTKLIELDILDPISENPINIKIKKVIKEKKILGFVRYIETTTGCNSSCLPLSFSLFYDSKGNFTKLYSADGLTKINHAQFTDKDYSDLEFILLFPNKAFDSVGHPKEMTDAISGATLKKFSGTVVKGAAYSTLRIHLYNQQTIKFIKSLKR